MSGFVLFLSDELGALSAERIVLGAGGLLLLAMLGSELLNAGGDAIMATLEPGFSASGDGPELADAGR